ncbi:MAG: hypothetical protein ACP5G8_09290, partial [Athalassotoga sp.]
KYECEVRILFSCVGDLDHYIYKSLNDYENKNLSLPFSSELLPLPNNWLDNDCKKFYPDEFKLKDLSCYRGGLNIKFNPKSLKEIIFGLEVSKDRIDEIKHKIQQDKIRIFQIKALNGVYEFSKTGPINDF